MEIHIQSRVWQRFVREKSWLGIKDVLVATCHLEGYSRALASRVLFHGSVQVFSLNDVICLQFHAWDLPTRHKGKFPIIGAIRHIMAWRSLCRDHPVGCLCLLQELSLRC